MWLLTFIQIDSINLSHIAKYYFCSNESEIKYNLTFLQTNESSPYQINSNLSYRIRIISLNWNFWQALGWSEVASRKTHLGLRSPLVSMLISNFVDSDWISAEETLDVSMLSLIYFCP